MTSSLQIPLTSPLKRFSSDTVILVEPPICPTSSRKMRTRPLSNHLPKLPMAIAALQQPNRLLPLSLTLTRTPTKQLTPGPRTQACGMSKDKPRGRPPILVQVTTVQLRRRSINSTSQIHKVLTTGVEEVAKARLVRALAAVPTPTLVDLPAGVVTDHLEVPCSPPDSAVASIRTTIVYCVMAEITRQSCSSVTTLGEAQEVRLAVTAITGYRRAYLSATASAILLAVYSIPILPQALFGLTLDSAT